MRLTLVTLLLPLALVGGGWAAFSHSRSSSASATFETRPAQRDPYVRGVALGLFATDPEWDYGPLLDEIRARGATDVLVVVNAYQSDRFASNIALRPGYSPSMHTVARTLQQVQDRGMRAALMPVVLLTQHTVREWRGVLTPADGLDAWFAAYTGLLLPLAAAAAQSGATRFVVGSELGSLEPYAEHWRLLITRVRERFSGALSYSANWDRIDAVPFWDALDEIGVTAYFPLPLPAHHAPSRVELASAWRSPRERIAQLSRRFGRAVLITEVGYPSQEGAAEHPWDDTRTAPIDLALQARLYEGFCEAFAQTAAIGGFYAWNWFGVGGPRDAGYSPRGKPAAAALSACFARSFVLQQPPWAPVVDAQLSRTGTRLSRPGTVPSPRAAYSSLEPNRPRTDGHDRRSSWKSRTTSSSFAPRTLKP